MKPLFPQKSYTLGITASRDLPPGSIDVIKEKMALYVNDTQISRIVFGGARGGDTEALRAALNARTNASTKLTVIVPMTVTDQPYETRHITQQADEIIELGLTYNRGVYLIRDQRIVDECTKLAAFWNGKEDSGTHKTMKMAEKANKTVETWVLNGR